MIALPFIGIIDQPVAFARPAIYRASPSAKSETITVTVSIPSMAWRFPKVKRTAPDCRSEPTRPITRPTPRDAIPRNIELPKRVPTVVKAINISAKKSAAVTLKAHSASEGAVNAKISVAIVPATNEPIAAVARAEPARPRFAIWWPSSAVMTEPDSPGVFNKIEVVDPPYIAP